MPPLKTQNSIVEYLEKHIVAYDRKVKALETKINSLKELRQSLIDFTISHGLSAKTKRRKSGVSYLGEIPAHWNLCRLKDLGTIETSSVDKKVVEGETLVKIVNYTDVYDNQSREIRAGKNYMVVSAKPQQIKEKGLEVGDVLFTPSSETIEEIGLSI